MPPICDSSSQDSQETVKAPGPLPSSFSVAQPEALPGDDDLDLYEPGPFYGMFDDYDEDDDSSCFSQPLSSSPPHQGADRTASAAIPEASETFQRVMRQLDDVEKTRDDHHPSRGVSGPGEEPGGRPERKASKVKKSASFSAACAPRSPASSSCSSSSSEPDAKRRMSVPCLRAGKHVQWADEAGVSDLVSVRLIKPRLARGDNKKQAQGPASPPSPRSILRRLSGMR